MVALKTQTPAYWQKHFVVGDDDLEYLHEYILEAGAPVATKTLTLALMKARCEQEIEAVRGEFDKGPMYQPKDSYEIGQTVIFPALGFAAGKVVGRRPGHDPSRGEFEVIQVVFEGSSETREFASKLQSPHSLNRDDGDDGLTFLKEMISVNDLLTEYGDTVEQALLERLRSPEQNIFVPYQSQWLVKEMLAEVHVGHLNIAEAAIEVAGAPLTTDQLLKDLDLPAEIDPTIRRFSLEAALTADERFDDVGWDGHVLWYLRRMKPEYAVVIPRRLQWMVESYDRSVITPDLLEIEKEIDDEAIGRVVSQDAATVYTARITLTYPHLRSGTLPLSAQLRSLFPKGSTQTTRVELIDGRRGETMPAWVNHEHGYVAGLSDWYHHHQIPTGAFLRLERTKKPAIVIIDFEPRRMRREWVRVANVQDGRISFGMQKRPISCDYDDLMAVDHMDAAQIDAFSERLQEERRPLADIVRDVVPELVKLSPAGMVHARTIYSAVNMFRRCPPGPVFALLSVEPCYVNEGKGLWSFDESQTS